MPEPSPNSAAIRLADGEADMETTRRLFRDYQDFLRVDLCFQGFEEELRGLPGKYDRPRGCILLAEAGVEIAGCVAVRPLDDHPDSPGVCEMKRLFVYGPFRGDGLGSRLAVEAIGFAARAGHRTMCLDTLERLGAAIKLYEKLGFVDTARYTGNPEPDARYMERALFPFSAASNGVER